MSVDASSLERLVPDRLAQGDATGAETLQLHVERYRFAARQARPGRLLDLACGVGYGTRLLADEAEGVVEALGVDVSPDAVRYAAGRYGGGAVRFARGDGVGFADAAGFDTIVSLETIEHVEDPGALVRHLAGLLRPGGVFVASVPTTPSVDVNPHHRHDFSEKSFRRLFDGLGLHEQAVFRQVQPFRILPLLRGREERASDLRPDLPTWYAAHPQALLRRLWATAVHGFANRYATIAWRAARP
jgi:SAM-dependent methyltransferase